MGYPKVSSLGNELSDGQLYGGSELADSCHWKSRTCLSSDPELVTKPDGSHISEPYLGGVT